MRRGCFRAHVIYFPDGPGPSLRSSFTKRLPSVTQFVSKAGYTESILLPGEPERIALHFLRPSLGEHADMRLTAAAGISGRDGGTNLSTDYLRELIAHYAGRRGVLLVALQDIQDHAGYIPQEAIVPLARALGTPFGETQ